MLGKNENQNFSQVFFNISNSPACFLQPSWISTVAFHLRITIHVFPSTNFRPSQDKYHVSWVCMAGPNCLSVTTLLPRHITYITYMTPMQCRIIYSYYTTPSLVYQCELNVSYVIIIICQCELDKKTLMCQHLIIVYHIVIIRSQ